MADQQTQIEIADELKILWLEEMRERIKSGDATSTDLATVARVLEHNGWTLDPADLPSDLSEHITREVDPGEAPTDAQVS